MLSVAAKVEHGQDRATSVPSGHATGGNALRNAMLHEALGVSSVTSAPSGHATGVMPLALLCVRKNSGYPV